MMDRLRDALGGSPHAEAVRLRKELDTLLKWSDAYLLHDLLEADNEPFTFGEFFERLEPHGLRFVAEADFASMVGADIPPDLARNLQRAAAPPGPPAPPAAAPHGTSSRQRTRHGRTTRLRRPTSLLDGTRNCEDLASEFSGHERARSATHASGERWTSEPLAGELARLARKALLVGRPDHSSAARSQEPIVGS